MIIVTSLRRVLAGVAWGLLLSVQSQAAESGTGFYLRTVQAPYTQVREELEWAITNQGLVINNVAHVGAMLERTAADLGGGSPYRHAEVFEFCSAGLSRRMMTENPDFILFCPYSIALYELRGRPGEVRLGFRRPQSPGGNSKALAAVAQLLKAIVDEAAGD